MTGQLHTDHTDPVHKLEALTWDFHSADTTYLTHNLHPYPAKFIPQIPNRLIHGLSTPRDTVADIFCGSGTTLLEALQLNRHAIGIDANPIAVLITKAKTNSLTTSDYVDLATHKLKCEGLLQTIEQLAFDSPLQDRPFVSRGWRPNPDMLDVWFLPHIVEELAELLVFINQVKSDSANILCQVAFSSIIVRVSKQDSDSRYVRRIKTTPVGDAIRQYIKQLTSAVATASQMNQLVDRSLSRQVLNANILDNPPIGEFDLMVTSPPYPNAYSYHLYHRTRLMWLGYDPEVFKASEIGSHRKYSAKGHNRATPDTFRAEFDHIFQWLRQLLKLGHHACFVIGDSKIRGDRMDNTSILSTVGARSGFREVARIERRIPKNRKALNPSIGGIHQENILILRKV